MGSVAETGSAISSLWSADDLPGMLPEVGSVFPFADFAGFFTSVWNCLALSLS